MHRLYLPLLQYTNPKEIQIHFLTPCRSVKAWNCLRGDMNPRHANYPDAHIYVFFLAKIIMHFQKQLNSSNLLLLGSPLQHASLCPGEVPRHVTLNFRLHLGSRTWYWTVEMLCFATTKYLSGSLTLALSLMRGAKPTWILDSLTSLNNQLIKVSLWLFFATFSNEIAGDSQEGNNIFTECDHVTVNTTCDWALK